MVSPQQCGVKTMPVESGITALAQRVGLEIKTLKAASIVADVVACYDNTSTGHAGTETDILHYDVTNLTDKDVVLVLKDEEHDGQKAYYRYNAAGTNLVFEIAEDKVDHPIATLTTFGAVKPDGSTISISDGVISYDLPTATASRLGGVKIAANGGLQITTAGVLSVKASALPIASNTTLGAVKIKSDGGLEITSAGELSVSTTSLPTATENQLGVVKIPNGSGLQITNDGALSVLTSELPIATADSLGVVKVDDTTIKVSSDGVLSVASGGTIDTSNLPIATTSSLGCIRVGEGFNIEKDTGILTIDTKIASTNTLGEVMIDTSTGLTISSTGLLGLNLASADASSLPIATEDKVGVVKPDGSTLRMDADGTMYVDLSPASKTSTGVMQVGDGLAVTSAGVVSINAKSPLTIADNTLQLDGYTEEVWELTMEDGTTVKRTFLSKTTG